ncbi:hypothetical protein AN214_02379 [Pseudoalteromonas sp. P1-9]|uniref:CsiV family protein n=1 Tax=Pseudoalteromonas sp. P1-9 TaxID=1710354 RepID=UPI0006D6399F|nr:CsiV family protein [Pseudoalteromonas sp. P1-9]KPV95461.1 hypothetical protein AN214_02379 [Pseudoalteromonas sp. P1-9]
MIIKYFLPLSLLSASFMVSANLRWFDIELIFFERPTDSELKEDLSAEDFPAINYTNSKDIIAEAYQELQNVKYKECMGIEVNKENGEQIDGLDQPAIRNDDVIEAFETSSQINNDDELDNLAQLECQRYSNVAELDALPLTPDALTFEHTDYIYLLSKEQLELNETVSRLKRRGLTPLLHTGWRQPESNIRNATPMYLYGGKNLSAVINKSENEQSLEQMLNEYTQFEQSEAIDLNGVPQSSDIDAFPSDIVNDFETFEDTPSPLLTEQTWQLQGKFKVFIRRNYLNIEADFDLNELVEQTVDNINFTDADNGLALQQLTETVLKTERFSQFRRVISSEIHYFDHPKLGIIMQIRRYNH